MKIWKRDWKWNALFIVILVGLFGYIYRDLFHWQMLSMMDLTPWSQTPGELYEAFSGSWMHTWLGAHAAMGPGDFMLQSILIPLFGGNAAMAQRIFWLSILPLSAINMRIFLGRFTNSNLAKLIIPFAYAVNGATITFFQIGTYAFLPPFAFFPLLMLYLLKILEEEERRWLNMLIFSLIYALLTSWVVYSLIYFIPFLVIFFLVEIAYRRNWKYSLKTSFLFVGSFGIMFLLIAPVGMDQLMNILGYYTKPTGTFGYYFRQPTEYLVFRTTVAYSYEEALSMFNNFTWFLGFSALGTLFIRHRTRLKYYLSLLLVATLLLLFAKLITMGWILSWFTYFPILFSFMHPGKFAIMMPSVFFVMMAILVSEVEERIALSHKPTLWFEIRSYFGNHY